MGWFGVTARPVPFDEEKRLGLPVDTGAIVEAVADGSPANKAGIKVGDVIVKFGSKKISLIDIPEIAGPAKSGRKFRIEFLRSGEKGIKKAIVEARTEPRAKPKIQITKIKSNGDMVEKCVDVRQFACKGGARGSNCIPFENNKVTVGPSDNGDAIDIRSVLGANCISKIYYTDIDGVEVKSAANQISVGYEMREQYGRSKIRAAISGCSYKHGDQR
jgi:membrane-associated protease RseP (regulator of RpoE activity)